VEQSQSELCQLKTTDGEEGESQKWFDHVSMTTNTTEKRLKVAIIGGGPGGLGAAIELAKLPFVDWELYEKKPQISETGGGMSLQPHTWRLLEHNGAARNIDTNDFYRGQAEQRRCAPSPHLTLLAGPLLTVSPQQRKERRAAVPKP
jgi:hypothetical protein